MKKALIVIMGLAMLTGCAHLAKRSSSATTVQSFGADAPLSFSPINRNLAPQNDTYYFGYDNDQMKSEDTAAADVQANYLAMHPDAKVRLEGHTDLRGSSEYNIGLGWRRAQSVAQRLEEQGVHPNQLKIISYGKERPVTLSQSAQAQSKNRRVNLIYIGK